MSTILQPCFQSQFIETATVKLKFTPSPSPPPPTTTTTSTTTDVCGLSFQQVLAGICSTPTAAATDDNNNKESIYVHPLSKRSSSSRFSEKSFEMCTENLGSETGTDDIMMMTENDDFFFYNKNNNIFLSSSSSSSSSPVSPSSPREYSSSRSPSFNKNCKKSHFNKINNNNNNKNKNFPPPLTTITGAKSIKVRSHREDGRLVMRAVPTPVTHTYLQAERSNGRLKLTLYHQDEINQIEREKEQEHDLEEEEEEEEEEINDNQEEKDYYYYYEDEEQNERDSNHIIIINEDECDQEIQEMGMGMEKYKSISRRCNESGGHHHTNTILYYKPLWVATS